MTVMLLFAIVWLLSFMIIVCVLCCYELLVFFLDSLIKRFEKGNKKERKEENEEDYFKGTGSSIVGFCVFFSVYFCAYFWLLNELQMDQYANIGKMTCSHYFTHGAS